MKPDKQPNVIDQLRVLVEACPESENAIAAGAGINQANLNHFLSGKRKGMSFATFAKLCEYLGLELVHRKRP